MFGLGTLEEINILKDMFYSMLILQTQKKQDNTGNSHSMKWEQLISLQYSNIFLQLLTGKSISQVILKDLWQCSLHFAIITQLYQNIFASSSLLDQQRILTMSLQFLLSSIILLDNSSHLLGYQISSMHLNLSLRHGFLESFFQDSVMFFRQLVLTLMDSQHLMIQCLTKMIGMM